MRLFAILALCAIALLSNACERHPLRGDPHPGAGHESHDSAKPEKH